MGAAALGEVEAAAAVMVVAAAAAAVAWVAAAALVVAAAEVVVQVVAARVAVDWAAMAPAGEMVHAHTHRTWGKRLVDVVGRQGAGSCRGRTGGARSSGLREERPARCSC